VVEVSVIKPGRRVQLTEARMIVDGRVAVTARAWHITTGDHPRIQGREQTVPPPVPRRGRQPSPFPQAWMTGVTDVRSSGGSLADLARVTDEVEQCLVDLVSLGPDDRVLPYEATSRRQRPRSDRGS
jgi:hypothetical protein